MMRLLDCNISSDEDARNDSMAPSLENSHVVRIGLGLVCTSVVVTVGVAMPFLRRFSGAPYVASTKKAREAIIGRLRQEIKETVGIRETLQVVDLGSGSGDVLLEAAQQLKQVQGIGYELNVWLVLLSRWRAYRQGVSSQVRFIRGDMWNAQLKNTNAVIIFGIPKVMSRFGEKLIKEAPHGCLVASNSFQIDDWRPLQRRMGVWFYRVDKPVKG